ncbi:hypothetical protein AVEN_117916-1 [Araneus ventricosus]|uniref:Uncharacterized protein n=1 Tax=Araneus ventricosus TaxID=182803 RepID=A0A4Y2JCE9_ARAVE|nr:hypothetical protein AVEN_117916-1 [Araneus ventricosus]
MIQILILDGIQATKGIILIYNLTLDRKSCPFLESLCELSSKPVNPEEAQCTSTSQKLGEWLIYSAATSHFCNNRDCQTFQRYQNRSTGVRQELHISSK